MNSVGLLRRSKYSDDLAGLHLTFKPVIAQLFEKFLFLSREARKTNQTDRNHPKESGRGQAEESNLGYYRVKKEPVNNHERLKRSEQNKTPSSARGLFKKSPG